jgi:hypothetical protein
MFRPSTLEILTDERVQSLKAFCDRAMPLIHKHRPDVEILIDVWLSEQWVWNILQDDPSTWEIVSPFAAKGGLDFIAACISEGKDIASSWQLIADFHAGEFEKDLIYHGLHGVHFRMNLKNPSDRIAYTCKLADTMLSKFSNANNFGIVPISSFSVLSAHLDESVEWYVANRNTEEKGVVDFSEQELKLLCGPTDQPRLTIEDNADFRQLVKSKVFGGEIPEYRMTWEMADKLETALFPLVYNFGYKLKAQGVSGPEVLALAASRVSALMSFVPGSSEFIKALERQVLINLFSAFPEDLELLNAQSEELQGVMLNPVLITDPLARFFRKTLAGPLVLFSSSNSSLLAYRATQMVNFFRDTPYPLHLDIALPGYLQNRTEIIDLAENCPGRSMVFEQLLLDEKPVFELPIGLIRHMANPVQLQWYSDSAVLRMMEILILKEDIQLTRVEQAQAIAEKVPSLGPVLSKRPHLLEPVVDILEKHDHLNVTLFEWCGYGHKELKALGKRAPNELKRDLLEDSLGF